MGRPSRPGPRARLKYYTGPGPARSNTTQLGPTCLYTRPRLDSARLGPTCLHTRTRLDSGSGSDESDWPSSHLFAHVLLSEKCVHVFHL
jgi:hypothetical protein